MCNVYVFFCILHCVILYTLIFIFSQFVSSYYPWQMLENLTYIRKPPFPHPFFFYCIAQLRLRPPSKNGKQVVNLGRNSQIGGGGRVADLGTNSHIFPVFLERPLRLIFRCYIRRMLYASLQQLWPCNWIENLYGIHNTPFSWNTSKLLDNQLGGDGDDHYHHHIIWWEAYMGYITHSFPTKLLDAQLEMDVDDVDDDHDHDDNDEDDDLLHVIAKVVSRCEVWSTAVTSATTC